MSLRESHQEMTTRHGKKHLLLLEDRPAQEKATREERTSNQRVTQWNTRGSSPTVFRRSPRLPQSQLRTTERCDVTAQRCFFPTRFACSAGENAKGTTPRTLQPVRASSLARHGRWSMKRSWCPGVIGVRSSM